MRAKIQACYLPILAQYVAVKDPRNYLKGFLIEPAPVGIGGCYLVATNGTHMIVIHDELATSDGIQIMEIPRRMLLECKPRPKRNHFIEGDLFVSFADKWATLEDKTGLIRGERCAPIDGKYPDWRRVICKERQGSNVYVNPNYLAQVNTSLKKAGIVKKYQAVKIELFGENHSMAIYPIDPDHKMVFIIMQMRHSGYGSESFFMQNIDRRWEKPVPPPELCTDFPEPNAMGFYEHDFGVVGVDSEGGSHE